MNERTAVLVTGGAGYIGAHCCKALAQAGYLPVCLDNLSTGHEAFVRWGPLVVGDIRDGSVVTAAVRTHRVQAVLHFAAFSAVGESVTDPQKYFLNNVNGTLSLLQTMRETGCDKIVFSSTGAVYGNAGRDPIREDEAGEVVNPYGRSKLMIEQILADYRAAYTMNSFCLRYFNASGADQEGEIGELRDAETHLIPRALMALQGRVTDFAIFGNDYDTPDGTAVRDYIHVTDLAEAHVRALQSLLGGAEGGCLNLGTGSGCSVTEILAVIASETGRNVPHTVKPRRTGDPAILVADPSAARTRLRFNPSHSDLKTIIRSAWAWHQKSSPLKPKA